MEFKVKQFRALSQDEKIQANKLGISERFLSLLLARGIELNEISSYLNPSFNNLNSPYQIQNMSIAKDRLLKAIKNKERIMIYGDYDCDGICATSILTLFLRDKTDVQYFIPTRNDGYGLTKTAIDSLLSRKKFDLLISVDCGITAVEEVDYLKSKGIDVIITDHHEPQDVIPNCIVVDPKIKKDGFFDLCGAGVALKLVEACSSRNEIIKYFDICSIATIADVVPLTYDNRIIVSFGLKQIEKNPRLGIRMLLGQDSITSQDVMFKLAPRMNSAGRLNTAMKVVDLFLEDDYFILQKRAEELMRDNVKRQDLCEVVVNEAIDMLKGIDLNKTRLITLYKENWEAGVIGIAAARIAEEFKCPTILFSKTGDDLKGSARSIPDVNLFELLSKFSDLFTSFGGHSQAAGVSLKIENYDKFVSAANQELISNKEYKVFLPKVDCEMELPFNMDFLSFAKELKLMEPTGNSNEKPNFLVKGDGLQFERIGNSQHVKYKNSNIELMGFSKFYESLFAKTGKVEFEITLDINEFQNREYAQGLIKSVNTKSIDLSVEDSKCLNLHHYNYSGEELIDVIALDKVNSLLDKPFGTLFICFSTQDYISLINKIERVKSLPVAISTTKFLNPENLVIICPGENFRFFQYNNVVICGNALSKGYYKHIKDESINTFSINILSKDTIELSDDDLRSIYKAISDVLDKDRKVKIGSKINLYKTVLSRLKVDAPTFYLALMILESLNLVEISDRGILNVSKTKCNLQNSMIYKNLNSLE